MKVALLATLLVLSLAVYDETIAKVAVGTVCWVYCDSKNFATDNCGECSRLNQENGLELLTYHSNGYRINIINLAIFKQESSQRIFVAFSGTQNPFQALYEAKDIMPVDYNLHSLPGAKVSGYWYHHYIDDFRTTMNNVLERINEKYSNYTYIFTGHSMGAAVSNMACMDAVLSNTVDG